MSTSAPILPTDTPKSTETLTPQPTETLLPTLIETLVPTLTLVPNEDSDSDGYLNSWELAWGNDPYSLTSFDDLRQLPGAITFTFIARQPYDIQTINLSPYQQMKLISETIIQDRPAGGGVEKPWKTAEFRVVIFPYIVGGIYSYIRSLKVPYLIPEKIKPYLRFTKTSNGCTAHDNVKIIGDTLLERVQSWQQFNNNNVVFDEKTESIPYMAMVSMNTCGMLETGKRSDSTTMATLFVSYLRESGIPAAFVYGYDATDIDQELHKTDLVHFLTRTNDQPQVGVWTPSYGWIILDPNLGFLGSRDEPYYVGIIYTALVPDVMDLNLDAVNGTGNGSLSSIWFFYSNNLQDVMTYCHIQG